jgi:two-component system KDP operon response regulator KdpE
MDPKVLVIDDDIQVRTMLRLGLELYGFEVTAAGGGREGLRQAYRMHPDVVVLDVAMEGWDGCTTCRRLRQVSDVPVIMLSGRASQTDIIKGLSAGADDYLVKPCSLEELAARIHSHLRRSTRNGTTSEKHVYDDGHLRVDLNEDVVRKDGELVELSPIEYRLLAHLVREQGRIVPHRDLLSNAWGPNCKNALKYLSVYIRYLRCKIEDDPSDPYYIQTRWKLGYCFSGGS